MTPVTEVVLRWLWCLMWVHVTAAIVLTTLSVVGLSSFAWWAQVPACGYSRWEVDDA